MAIFTLEDEQLVWRDKSSDIALFASSIPPRRANRQFVCLNPSECEFRSDFGRLVRLDGQIVFTDGQIQTTKLSENLFVRFSHQTICPSTAFWSSSSVKTANVCVISSCLGS